MISFEKFARGLKTDTTVYLGFVEETMGQLSFKHCATHKTEFQEVGIGHEHSERVLDDMKASFHSLFIKTTCLYGKIVLFLSYH